MFHNALCTICGLQSETLFHSKQNKGKFDKTFDSQEMLSRSAECIQRTLISSRAN